ncbi:MAG: hypothetical protein H9882_05920 [Candidatus Fournierella pullistercoris]|uniref:Uncharacterized protein n=1 Tax=Candidatus Allofournierella pullistercoris TaxID=2838597 RepID=A0A948T2U7_9FIRM|nr:hypothetical protein [Candidatus Fournierella pullistercoris]
MITSIIIHSVRLKEKAFCIFLIAKRDEKLLFSERNPEQKGEKLSIKQNTAWQAVPCAKLVFCV